MQKILLELKDCRLTKIAPFKYLVVALCIASTEDFHATGSSKMDKTGVLLCSFAKSKYLI